MRRKQRKQKKRKKINKGLANIVIAAIKVYQRTFSPDKWLPSFRLKGRICHHKPHCSQYGIEVLKKNGFYPGIIYMIDRITSCTGAVKKTKDPSSYKVIFFSSAPIGLPFLEELENDPRYECIGVVTTPDKPSWRGMKVKENIIKTTAKKMQKEVVTPPSLRTISKKYGTEATAFETWLKEKKPDLLVVIAYGKIIPQSILDIPQVGPINVHGSLLPEYRGASPIQSIFLDGKKESWITIMRMDAWLDTGPMLAIKETTLYIERTALDLIKRMQKEGPAFLNNTMRDYAKGHLDEQQQDNSKATHCGKIEKEQGKIDLYTQTLEEVYHIYQGCYLRPKTRYILDERRGKNKGKRIIIEECIINKENYQAEKNKTLITQNKQLNKAIVSLKIKPEGSKAMSREDFLKGYTQEG